MSNFRIALVNPSDPHIPRQDYAMYENLALAFLASYLREHGYPVKIVDGYAEDLSHDAVAKQVVEFNPQFVGFTCTYQDYPGVLEIGSKLRTQLPKVHFTIGGEQATYTALPILTELQIIDSVVRGEGEETLLELVTALQLNRPLDGVRGLYFKQNGVITQNPDRAPIGNLDALPFASRDTLREAAHLGKSISIGMLASRGCYSKCSFCNANEFFRLGGGKVVRRRSPQNVIEEIAEIYENYGQGMMQRGIEAQLYFYDATFISSDKISKQWGREFAEGLIQRGISIPFKAFVRANSFSEKDEDLVTRLKQAGLSSVFVGFESATDSDLDVYNKGTSAEDNIKAVALLRRFGIFGVTNGFIMFGPYSTLDDLKRNALFLLQSDLASYWNLSQRLQLLPGVQITKRLKMDGLLIDTISREGIYAYHFKDSRVGILAERLNFNNDAVAQRENSLIRYIRHILEEIKELESPFGEYRSGYGKHEEVLDLQIKQIHRFNYEIFYKFIDLGEAGWSDDTFLEIKTSYLQNLSVKLDLLEDSFQTYLEQKEQSV